MNENTSLKRGTLLLIFLAITLSVPAEEMDGTVGFLEKMEMNLSCPDSSLVTYRAITCLSREQGDSLFRVHRFFCMKDTGCNLLLIASSPDAIKGSGVLKKGDEWWLYNNRIKTFFIAAGTDRIDSTALSCLDFLPAHYSSWYAIESREPFAEGPDQFTLITLRAKTKTAPFAVLRVRVAEPELLPMREECYDHENHLVRTRWLRKWERNDQWYIPTEIVVVRGENPDIKTLLFPEKIVKSPLPDYIFTRSFLEFLGY
ncbi:MAG: outer membrane lipoprotein-sorting protein [Spirochaetales bacterium]|nr:outer membrane lipoprotein-sorting protein [Spirochaetales bacterium]